MTEQPIVKLNRKQEIFLYCAVKTRLFLGGRGSGKSFALGLSILDKAIMMPRSRGALASTTYNQIQTKTFGAISKAWEELGYIKDVHYVVGKTPPKHFALPYNAPTKWQNIITFYWGSCVDMISLDRPDLARGGSYDYIEIDEAALLKKTDWTKILLPSIRDNRNKFGNCPFHQQASFYTSIPWKPSGYWILDFEDKHKFEEEHKIRPKKYFCVESNAYDNIHILGEEGIERMREELDYLEFQIEVMNKRIRKVKNAFYNKFDADHHTYRPRYHYDDKGEDGIMSLGSNDVDSNKFLEMSFDFGGWINSCTIWQERKGTEYCVDEFYRKGDNTLKDLVNDICAAYKHHNTKQVRVWGEPRGHDKQPDGPTLFQSIKSYFALNGWQVEVKAPQGYKTEKHKNRREFMNDIFDEQRKDLPRIRFNEDKCKNTIIVMQTVVATTKGDKDKTGERDRERNQEHEPHLSDTVDYYIGIKYGKRNYEDEYDDAELMAEWATM